MKILISNDDGYLAPGINALAEQLSSFADIVVVAPDSNRSGSSNSLTLDRPLRVMKSDKGYYSINGTPSDCVHIALTGLLDERPDLVVSGINQGQNMGDDTLYSGTVAAATEGFLFGISAIAFSQVDHGWSELASAARLAKDIVQRNLDALSAPFLLNVNIPNRPYAALGNEIFWIGPVGKAKEASEGTDFHAIEQGWVSVTPLQIDLTHNAQLERLKQVLG